MMFTKIIAMAFVLCTSSLFAIAGVVVDEREVTRNSGDPYGAPISGYAVVEPTFSGSLLGEKYELNGTVEEVFTQLEKIHHINNLTTANLVGEGSPVDPLPATLTKRNKVLPPLCIPVKGQSWKWAYGPGINAGINRLKQIKGTSRVAGRSCARLTCYSTAAIWLCNDRPEAITPGNEYLATYAENISGDCRLILPFTPTYVGGQLFDTDNYNVIARGEPCS